MKRSSFVAAGAVVTALLASEAASAEGFSLNRYEPSERGSDWFANESLDLRGAARPAMGVVGDYQYRPLAIHRDDEVVRSVVRNQLNAHVGASVVAFDRLRLAASMPIVLFTDGHAGQARGEFQPSPPREQGIGDLRFGADFRLLGEYGEPITVALGAQVWAPTGDRELYTTDGKIRAMPRLTAAGDIGVFAYAARLGFHYRALEEELAGGQVGSELVLGGAAGLRVLDKKLLLGPEVFMSTVTANDRLFEKRSTPAEGLFGAHYRMGLLQVGAGFGTGFTRGFGSPEIRALLSLEVSPEIVIDNDGDGIADRDDACPHAKGIATADRRTNGCPPAPADRDGDHVGDEVDACPDMPGVKRDDPSMNGCPDAPLDRDGDGVRDGDDACPDAKGIASTETAFNGCPDRDRDGIFDKVDACPEEPGLKTDDPKTNGCPDPDRDKDGIPNAVDACPDEPGPADPDPKKNGCPKAAVRGDQIVIIEQVRFKSGSAQIQAEKDTEDILDAVAVALKAHPEITKLRIEGHTDNTGGAALNKKLSADRAASVLMWLAKKGIDKGRLTSVGYGPDRPREPNTTEEGRTANRRVEFHIEPEANP